MRVAAVQEDAPELFNAMMYKLRETYRDGPSGLGAIWTQIRTDGSGLITNSESPEAKGVVSEEEAATFWEIAAANAPAAESMAPGQEGACLMASSLHSCARGTSALQGCCSHDSCMAPFGSRPRRSPRRARRHGRAHVKVDDDERSRCQSGHVTAVQRGDFLMSTEKL